MGTVVAQVTLHCMEMEVVCVTTWCWMGHLTISMAVLGV